MAIDQYTDEDETKPLNGGSTSSEHNSHSRESVESTSTSSIALERLNGLGKYDGNAHAHKTLVNGKQNEQEDDYDEEDTPYSHNYPQPVQKRVRRILWALGGLALGGWLLALLLFLSRQNHTPDLGSPQSSWVKPSHGTGKAVTIDEVLGGTWHAKSHQLSWIRGVNGEDGLLLEREGGGGRDYLVVEAVRSRKPDATSMNSKTLIKDGGFKVNGRQVYPSKVWPSPDLKKVLVMYDEQKNWRHSFTGKYCLYNVEKQTAEAIDHVIPGSRIQLASWSPKSDSVVFTRDNNMYLRQLTSLLILQLTKDGGPEHFYGVPDWVYEEEVFSGNSATWWSESGNYIAFLRTDESSVPEYPIQYFVSRPSGNTPPPGQENYPEVRKIKYPKAGAPNPLVNLMFYDVAKEDVFSVKIENDFPDDDRLITEVIWAGDSKVLVKETNRESDILKVILVDVSKRTGKVVRTVDVNGIDGGWFEVSEKTRFIPSDPANNRPYDGYVDQIINEGYDHLAYFSPLDNDTPKVLTSGKWEVVDAPSAVDLKKNLVYFIAAKESPTQRGVYSVKLDGTDLQALSDTSKEAYYEASFSTGAGYALLSYKGPDIPWQRVISTPSNTDHFDYLVEDNKALAKTASAHELPLEIYQNVTIDGIDLQVVERRPAYFDENKKYPVLFHLYGGPGSQTVDKKFNVDFQSYVASNLGYVVVTVDGRGTGYIGREARCVIRGNIGVYEARDQIETAKIWAKKPYVDEERIAIWGWSYGGFMTLKTLEIDGGQTFKYGMAVAPVTDWRFYGKSFTRLRSTAPFNRLPQTPSTRNATCTPPNITPPATPTPPSPTPAPSPPTCVS